MTKEKLIELLEIDFRECIEKAISDDIVRDEYELRDALELAIEIVRKEKSEEERKMTRTYDVWTTNGIVEVKAEELRRVSLKDKPTKIYFITGDSIVAEFYVEHTCGWVERKEE